MSEENKFDSKNRSTVSSILVHAIHLKMTGEQGTVGPHVLLYCGSEKGNKMKQIKRFCGRDCFICAL